MPRTSRLFGGLYEEQVKAGNQHNRARSVYSLRSRSKKSLPGNGDRDAFLKQAAEINLGEVQLGKLAEQKGNNPAIREFGRRMVEDHTKAEDNLRQIAQQQGVTLPSNAGST